jgi:DNA-binding MarR family transcriptional regulator
MDAGKSIVRVSGLAEEIKKRLPFASPAEEAFLNLLRTHAELTTPGEALFKQYGISPAKYNILRILRGSRRTGECGKHGLPSLEIAQRLITRVPDITRLVDGLQAAGLVARTRCSEDRRVVYVGLTRKGLELVDSLDEPLCEMHRHVFSEMSEAELAELNRLLVKARKPAVKKEAT